MFDAFNVKVKLVLLAMEATVPIAVPAWVVITDPTVSSVKKLVEVPVTVVDAVEDVTVPDLLIFILVQVPAALQLPVAPDVTVPDWAKLLAIPIKQKAKTSPSLKKEMLLVLLQFAKAVTPSFSAKLFLARVGLKNSDCKWCSIVFKPFLTLPAKSIAKRQVKAAINIPVASLVNTPVVPVN